MTKYIGPKDPGYVRVSNQLWLWVDTLQQQIVDSAAANWQPESSGSEAAGRRNQRLAIMQDMGSVSYSGYINSGGGSVFQGNQTAGRDFNFSGGPR